MTLEQIKDEVAKEFGYDDEKHFYYCAPIDKCVEYVNEVCKRYATACVKASQEKIAKNASAYISYGGCNYEGEQEPYACLDKDKILSPDKIVLL